MAEVLRLREAARLIGMSPGKLYRAIANGWLTAAPGGGPGKPTLVSLGALQAFCQSEGLRVPDAAKILERSERLERAKRSEHAERSMSPADEALARQALETMAGQYLAQVMARQSDYFEAFLRDELDHMVNRVVERVVEQMVERLTERFERSERPERSMPAHGLPPSPLPVMPDPKAAVLQRLQAMQAEGLSLQKIADRLNKEGVPTLSGKGKWQKGTIGHLLAQVEV
jgi:predicted DNA-binding transcriptional regulator AlpA